MGKIYNVKCFGCDYEEKFYIGVGQDDINMKEEVIQTIKNEGYGDDALNFFINAENSDIECKRMLYRCRKCGNLETKIKMRIITHNISFSQPYYCTECGKMMGQVKVADIKKQACPKCSKEVNVVSIQNF